MTSAISDTLTCPNCGRSITLAVIGSAYCLPCRRAMRPTPGGGDKRQKTRAARH